MGALLKLKRKAATASRAAEKEVRRMQRQLSKQSLQDVSASNGRPLVQPTPKPSAKPAQKVDGDAETGPGTTARLKAFLSVRGFDPSGIKTAQAQSASARTHRDRRLLAASQRQHPVQRPNLNIIPSARSKLEAPQTPKLRTVRADKTASRLLRRSRIVKSTPQLPLSGIDSLRQDLGLLNQDSRLEDAVYVAIDTEGFKDVTEVGISTLDARDIQGITPDHRAANWISKIKHKHIVMRRSSPPSYVSSRTSSTLFCTSEMDTVANARAVILSTLQLARQMSPDHPKRKVHLVGQSIANDVALLKLGAFRLNLTHDPTADFTFDSVYDTQVLGLSARSKSAPLKSMRLGELARTLEVDPKYWSGSTVQGTHNSSNDAAYTMMVMLLFAVRWEKLAKELPKQPPPPLLNQLKVNVTPGAVNVMPGATPKQIARAGKHLGAKGHHISKTKAKRRADLQNLIAYREASFWEAYRRAGLVGKTQLMVERVWRRVVRVLWGPKYKWYE